MNDRFLRACRRQPVDCTPVWFMRQAGRYMPEYRALRARYSMMQLCREPSLAAQVTLQPMRLGVDAAIVFSDILLPLDPMGAAVRFVEGHGPVIDNPVRTARDVEALRRIEPRESLRYVMDAIGLAKKELEVPLIGFCGAPFTLASYLVEGGHSSQHLLTKSLMLGHPKLWHRLMQTLSQVVLHHLQGQIEAGADAVQIFDSWVGQLNTQDYETFVLPHVRQIIAGIASYAVPVIYFGTATATLLAAIATTGANVISVDWRVNLDDAWTRIGHDLAIQGNLDPCVLCAPMHVIEARVNEILDRASGRPGHIFNLGHGILPPTPPENVAAVVELVHRYSSQHR